MTSTAANVIRLRLPAGMKERWAIAQQRAQIGDFKGALKILESIAADGYAAAYTEIGLIYERGAGRVGQDLDASAKYYQKAIASFDDPFAHARLGAMYYNGRGVTKDKKKAFEHLQKGEEANQPDALTMLGLYFALGVEVPPSLERARLLFRAAANQGFVLAMFYLANTERRMRNYRAALRWRFRATVETFRIGLRYGKGDWRLAGLTP